MIKYAPIDDLGIGPRVLIIEIPYYLGFSFRIRPLYLRLVLWLTRKSLVTDVHRLHKESKFWADPLIQIGSLAVRTS